MREVKISNVVIIKIFDWEVSKHASICKFMFLKEHLSAVLFVIDMVGSPLSSPFLGLEANWEWTSHLYSSADRQVRCCLLVEEAEDAVVEVNWSAGELNTCEFVVLQKGNLLNSCFEGVEMSVEVEDWFEVLLKAWFGQCFCDEFRKISDKDFILENGVFLAASSELMAKQLADEWYQVRCKIFIEGVIFRIEEVLLIQNLAKRSVRNSAIFL